MAMTNADRQRKWRERLRTAAETGAAAEAGAAVLAAIRAECDALRAEVGRLKAALALAEAAADKPRKLAEAVLAVHDQAGLERVRRLAQAALQGL